MLSTYRYQTTKVRKWFHPEDTSTFISGYKLMAYGRFFFLHEIVMNVKICYSMFESSWDLALVTFRTPMVTSWMVTVWYQSVFKVFQGPIFFHSSYSILEQSRIHTENCYRRLQRWPAPLHSGNGLFPVFILSSPAITIFKDVLHFPKTERLQACEIFSQLYFIIASRLFILSCTLLHVLFSPK